MTLNYSSQRSATLPVHAVTEIANITGLGRESLYKALAPGARPRYDTVIKVMHAVGIKLEALEAV